MLMLCHKLQPLTKELKNVGCFSQGKKENLIILLAHHTFSLLFTYTVVYFYCVDQKEEDDPSESECPVEPLISKEVTTVLRYRLL